MNIETSIPFNQKRRPSLIYVNSESNDNNDDNTIISSKETKDKKNKDKKKIKVYCCLGYIFFPPKNKKIYP